MRIPTPASFDDTEPLPEPPLSPPLPVASPLLFDSGDPPSPTPSEVGAAHAWRTTGAVAVAMATPARRRRLLNVIMNIPPPARPKASRADKTLRSASPFSRSEGDTSSAMPMAGMSAVRLQRRPFARCNHRPGSDARHQAVFHDRAGTARPSHPGRVSHFVRCPR